MTFCDFKTSINATKQSSADLPHNLLDILFQSNFLNEYLYVFFVCGNDLKSHYLSRKINAKQCLLDFTRILRKFYINK